MKKSEPVEWTDAQKACIAMLEEWACGAHHLPKVRDWGRGVTICYGNDLSTFDADRLTSLVLLAHRDGIRVEVSGDGGPRQVRISCHKRISSDDRKEFFIDQRHPTLTSLKSRIETMIAESA